MYLNSVFVHPTVIFRSEILSKTGNYPFKYRRAAQDYAFFFNIIKHYKAENYPEILLDYVMSNRSISNKKRKLQVYHRIRIIIDNFYLGITPIYSLARNLLLLLIPVNILTFIKSKLYNADFRQTKHFQSYFLFFVFSLAFIGDKHYAIPNGINISLVLMFPFLVNKKQVINHIVKKPIIWFAIFLSFIMVKSVLLGHLIEDISVIKKLSQVLLLLILSCGLKTKSIDTLKSGFILGTLIAVIYSVIKIGIIVIQTSAFNFAKGPIINETLPVQRLYLGLLCTISLILVLQRFFKNRQKLNLFLAALFTSFVFLIAARIAIFSILIVIIYNVLMPRL